MDLAIAIRTGVITNGKLHIQAGAGIVADSIPQNNGEKHKIKRKHHYVDQKLLKMVWDSKLEYVNMFSSLFTPACSFHTYIRHIYKVELEKSLSCKLFSGKTPGIKKLLLIKILPGRIS